jgi:hypothetical protein
MTFIFLVLTSHVGSFLYFCFGFFFKRIVFGRRSYMGFLVVLRWLCEIDLNEYPGMPNRVKHLSDPLPPLSGHPLAPPKSYAASGLFMLQHLDRKYESRTYEKKRIKKQPT